MGQWRERSGAQGAAVEGKEDVFDGCRLDGSSQKLAEGRKTVVLSVLSEF
jgi:hypothetical protein